MENEFIRTYLKIFNEEMLKVKDLIEQVTSEALISTVREKTLWRELYALLDKRLLKVKQAI
jgi:dihydroorotase